jgi:integration host factor subunit alpha
MALTKSQIVNMIVEQNGFTRNKSIEIVDSLIELIKATLESCDNVLVSGFGKFCVKNKNQRRGRNPASVEDILFDTMKVVVFKCSGKLKERINTDF